MPQRLRKLIEEFIEEEGINCIEELDITLKKIYTKMENEKIKSEKKLLLESKKKYLISLVEEWKEKPLNSIYPFIYFYKKKYLAKVNNKEVQKSIYIILGITLKGNKTILGVYLNEKNTIEFVHEMIVNLKNRGVQNLLVAFTEKILCIEKSLRIVFPETEIQNHDFYKKKEIIKKIKYKDRKEFGMHLNLIFNISNKELRRSTLESLSEKWKKEYSSTIEMVKNNCRCLNLLHEHPQEIKEIITNLDLIKMLDDQIYKIILTEIKDGDYISLLDKIHLMLYNSEKQWEKKPLRNWKKTLDKLIIRYEDRVLHYLK